MSGPQACEEIILPAISDNQDCAAFELYESQVCGLILTRGTPPLDWTSAPSWRSVILNGASLDEAAKYLLGIGEIPAPDKTTFEGAKGNDVISSRRYTLTFRVANLTDQIYNFLIPFQCGFTGFRFWVETVGGHLFGGPGGIVPLFCDVDFPSTGGAVITITWQSRKETGRTDWEPFDPTDNQNYVYAYGPIFNEVEVYGPVDGGDEYYTYS